MDMGYNSFCCVKCCPFNKAFCLRRSFVKLMLFIVLSLFASVGFAAEEWEIKLEPVKVEPGHYYEGERCVAIDVRIKGGYGSGLKDPITVEVFECSTITEQMWPLKRNGAITSPYYCDEEGKVFALGPNMYLSSEVDDYRFYIPEKIINHRAGIDYYLFEFYSLYWGKLGAFKWGIDWKYSFEDNSNFIRNLESPIKGAWVDLKFFISDVDNFLSIRNGVLLSILVSIFLLIVLLLNIINVDDNWYFGKGYPKLMISMSVFSLAFFVFYVCCVDGCMDQDYYCFVFPLLFILYLMTVIVRSSKVGLAKKYKVNLYDYEDYGRRFRLLVDYDKKQQQLEREQWKEERKLQQEQKSIKAKAVSINGSRSSNDNDSDNRWVIPAVIFGIIGILAIYWDAGGDFGRSKRQRSSSYNYNYDYDYNIGAGSFGQDPAGHNTVGFGANKRVDGAENTSDGYIPSGQITLYRRSNGDACVFDLYINSTNRYVKVGKNAFKKIKNGEVEVNGVTYCTKP